MFKFNLKTERMFSERGKIESGPVSVGTAFDTVVAYLKNQNIYGCMEI